MTHNIAYHADIDGIISAALHLKFNINSPSNYRLFPVLSSYRGKRFVDLITNLNLKDDDQLAIFDFEYNERANLWVDHHPSRVMGTQPINSKKIIYNPSSDSSAQLLYKSISSLIGCEPIKLLIDSVNMIDSANYPSVKFIFTNTDPMMILRAFVEQEFPNDMTYARIVEVLTKTDFDLIQTLSILNLNHSEIDRLRSNVDKSKQFMEVYNQISLIRQKRIGQFPRYSESYTRPEVKYNVRVSPVGYKKWQMQLSHNRWHKDRNELNIGKFIGGLDYVYGGGHFHVGGGAFGEDDLERFIDDLSLAINNEGDPTMEKYGVDQKEDKFEQKAEELVKTGAAKNIDEARESITKEESKDGTSSETGGNSSNS